jgi:hypothetical protein
MKRTGALNQMRKNVCVWCAAVCVDEAGEGKNVILTVDNLGSNTPPSSSLLDYQFRLFKAPIIRGSMDIYPVPRAGGYKIKLSWLFSYSPISPPNLCNFAARFKGGNTLAGTFPAIL